MECVGGYLHDEVKTSWVYSDNDYGYIEKDEAACRHECLSNYTCKAFTLRNTNEYVCLNCVTVKINNISILHSYMFCLNLNLSVLF